MSYVEIRWILGGDAVIALARAYAQDMQVEWFEALKRSQVTILRYLSAGHWAARAGAYHCEKSFTNADGKRHDVKLERVWDHDNQERVIPIEYWQILQKSGADKDANWHLSEFDLPLYSEAGITYVGFAKRVEFDRATVAQAIQISASSTAPISKKAGRPLIGSDKYLPELERLIRAGQLASSVADQSRELQRWYRAMYPDQKAPVPGTIENAIRERFRDAKAAIK